MPQPKHHIPSFIQEPCPHRASLILNSKFCILNYPVLHYQLPRSPIQNSKFCILNYSVLHSQLPSVVLNDARRSAAQDKRPWCSNRNTTAFYSMKPAPRTATVQLSIQNVTFFFKTERRDLQPKLLYQVVGMPPAVDDKEHEADIHTYTALQGRVEADVARHGIPVAVKGQADEFTAPVEHGTA